MTSSSTFGSSLVVVVAFATVLKRLSTLKANLDLVLESLDEVEEDTDLMLGSPTTIVGGVGGNGGLGGLSAEHEVERPWEATELFTVIIEQSLYGKNILEKSQYKFRVHLVIIDFIR